jgi:diaminopimelate epimerase
MGLDFTKMQGLGNDFVVIDGRQDAGDLEPDAIAWLCDRHFGVGADGVILLQTSTVPEADWAWTYYNADGTAAEMCGNGIRCLARWLLDRGLVTGDEVRIQTLLGVQRVEIVTDPKDGRTLFRVDMGEPILDPKRIPTTLPGEQVFECPITTSAGEVSVTAVSMGNPHAVIWVQDVFSAPVGVLGPLVENHPAFPRKTNVEFAELVSDDRIRLRVWERGVGETLACGTGACAAVVAAVLSCRTGRTATVELLGGELVVGWSPEGPVFMTGPAEEVFEGFVPMGEDG